MKAEKKCIPQIPDCLITYTSKNNPQWYKMSLPIQCSQLLGLIEYFVSTFVLKL